MPFYRQALAAANECEPDAQRGGVGRQPRVGQRGSGEWDEPARFNNEARRLKKGGQSGDLMSQHVDRRGDREGPRSPGRSRAPVLRSALRDEIRGRACAGRRTPAWRTSPWPDRGPDEASRHFEAALDTIEKTRSDLLKTDYKLTFLTRLILFYQSYVDALVDQGRIDRALEVSESSRGRVLAERNNLAPPLEGQRGGVPAASPRESRTTLLSYWLGGTVRTSGS